MAISKEDFQQWQAQPITEWVLQQLQLRAHLASDQAAQQLYLGASQPEREAWERHRLSAVFTRGQCDALDFVISLQFEDIAEESK